MAFQYIDIDNEQKVAIDDTMLWYLIYPVGTLYWTTINKSPMEIFPNKLVWRWERIEDRFVYAKSANSDKSLYGGAAEYTLTENNIPKHSHSMNHKHFMKHKHDKGNMNITGSISQDVTGYGAFTTGAFTNSGQAGHVSGSGSGTGFKANFNARNTWTGHVGIPVDDSLNYMPFTSEAESVGSSENNRIKVFNTGTWGQQYPNPIPTMPPYYSAYCWRRVE